MNADYQIKPGGLVSVCGNCFPGRSILAKYPELEGLRLSHGFCAHHKKIYLDEIAQIKVVRAVQQK